VVYYTRIDYAAWEQKITGAEWPIAKACASTAAGIVGHGSLSLPCLRAVFTWLMFRAKATAIFTRFNHVLFDIMPSTWTVRCWL